MGGDKRDWELQLRSKRPLGLTHMAKMIHRISGPHKSPAIKNRQKKKLTLEDVLNKCSSSQSTLPIRLNASYCIFQLQMLC